MEINLQQKKSIFKRFWFRLLAFIILIVGTFIGMLYYLYPYTSPLNVIQYYIYAYQHPHQKMSAQTIAFAPYWKSDNFKYTRFDLLSEISFFSLTADGNGDIVTMSGKNEEAGSYSWNSNATKDFIAKSKISGDKVTLTIAMQKNADIESLLNSPSHASNLIKNIVYKIHERNLDGIIIDFEYNGVPDEKLKDNFTEFSSGLLSTMRSDSADTTLSLTLAPLAVREKSIFDLKKLSPIYNRFIGMSYDYYTTSATNAEPTAPLFGFREDKYFFDVATTYQDYLKFIPKEKLIMGIPYYGYDWTVEDLTKYSKTLPSTDPNNYAAAISYGRFRDEKLDKTATCEWDDTAHQNLCWYMDVVKETYVYHEMWIEDSNSIKDKYNFAKQNKFSGIAIWALGYDNNYPDLWNVMDKSFKK